MSVRQSALLALADDSPDLWDAGFGEVAKRLLTAGVRCFASTGFHATTTRDITKAAALSPAALYVHFASKEDVLFEITRSGHRRVLEVVRSTEDADDPSVYLKALVARFVAWHARHHVAARVSQYELSALTAEHYEVIAGLRQQTTAVFEAAIQWGVEQRAFGVVDAHRLVRAILSLGVDLVRWYRLDGADSPDQLGGFYAELALGMVAAATSAEAT
ncbi:TetR family transcriptional regulator [Tamaricihabitans halophyticus]|uniref:TetR family transcriptional regulator n=1 Tax=Tamaricihabitans halophyticus TaxID=1262583 RepID=A0A4R2PZV5_9PSEU|nr:TetR/AcrR family transcriptional regulator [Tamaricihabitans halophyticus]TCP41629.1 TetR family transcriptional regulator [Tamaricihabitans halophyticus]